MVVNKHRVRFNNRMMNPVRNLFMYYTYVLKSKKNGRIHTGYTADLRKRFKEHNDAKSEHTKTRGPYELIYYEACLNTDDARSRELYLKSGKGKRYLKSRPKRFLSRTTNSVEFGYGTSGGYKRHYY